MGTTNADHEAAKAADGATYRPLFHVVLYAPEIPYNTGSVGRTCVAVGAKLWLVRPLGFRVDDYYLRRAGLDYWQHLAWQVVDDWAELEVCLPAERHWYFSKKAQRLHARGVYGGRRAGVRLRVARVAPGIARRAQRAMLAHSH